MGPWPWLWPCDAQSNSNFPFFGLPNAAQRSNPPSRESCQDRVICAQTTFLIRELGYEDLDPDSRSSLASLNGPDPADGEPLPG
jgi:hypothetical protein